MYWLSRALGIALLGAATAAPSIAAQRYVITQPYVIGPRVIVRPYAYYGPYGRVWYGYHWGPRYYAAVPAYTYPQLGQIKIDSHLKDATVYVDRGYVGPISKFRKFGLSPGGHDIEIRNSSGQIIFSRRIQAIAGKTVEIRPPA
jgi:hypothetical protein